MPQGDNQAPYQCSSDKASLLGYSVFGPFFDTLVSGADPVYYHRQYLTIYVAPGLSPTNLAELQQLSAPGGFIEQFVMLGGLAVINVANANGSGGEITNLAPGGVGYRPGLHNRETILDGNHPYISGNGYGGNRLDSTTFVGWTPTDGGTLTRVPPNAKPLLANTEGPSWIEYPYGLGRVIVTTLTYCTSQTVPAAMGPALDNLFRYSLLFDGGAQTPAATVTPTATPTATATGQVSNTPTRTRTATETPFGMRTRTFTPTPTATPLPCVGDCSGDNNVTINELLAGIKQALGTQSQNGCPSFDLNSDAVVTIDELVLAVHYSLNGCPRAGSAAAALHNRSP